jgi:hypothetical protein
MLGYIVTAAFYSITEAGFRMLDAIWIFFLLAVAASGEPAWDAGEQQDSLRLAADDLAAAPADDSSALTILGEEN